MKYPALSLCFVSFYFLGPIGALADDPAFVDLESAKFTNPTAIDNKWLPLKPGTGVVLEGTTTEEGEDLERRIEFLVTGLTKEIGGVETVVAYIDDFSDGQLVESELAFYAQDDDGNVWYFGEYPEEYEDGEFVAAKPWIHGFEDAKAGMKMKAAPMAGEEPYFQGWGPAVDWNDFAFVAETGKSHCLQAECYEDVLAIKETSLDEEGAYQLKYYAPEIGNIAVGWEGDDASREELELVEQLALGADQLEELNSKAMELEKRAFEKNAMYGKTVAMK